MEKGQSQIAKAYILYRHKKTEDKHRQALILGKENNQFFVDSINKAKEEYKIKIIDEANNQRESDYYIWNVPESVPYNIRAKEVSYRNSIMKPHYSKQESKPEKEFIDIFKPSILKFNVSVFFDILRTFGSCNQTFFT